MLLIKTQVSSFVYYLFEIDNKKYIYTYFPGTHHRNAISVLYSADVASIGSLGGIPYKDKRYIYKEHIKSFNPSLGDLSNKINEKFLILI